MSNLSEGHRTRDNDTCYTWLTATATTCNYIIICCGHCQVPEHMCVHLVSCPLLGLLTKGDE